jgi:hypothetical protein
MTASQQLLLGRPLLHSASLQVRTWHCSAQESEGPSRHNQHVLRACKRIQQYLHASQAEPDTALTSCSPTAFCAAWKCAESQSALACRWPCLATKLQRRILQYVDALTACKTRAPHQQPIHPARAVLQSAVACRLPCLVYPHGLQPARAHPPALLSALVTGAALSACCVALTTAGCHPFRLASCSSQVGLLNCNKCILAGDIRKQYSSLAA